MKRELLFAFFLAACVASSAEAGDFDVTVGTNYDGDDIKIESKKSLMEMHWFVEKTGGRTVYSNDVRIGHKPHGVRDNSIHSHATFVIYTTKGDDEKLTVNLDANKVHVTSWYPHVNQRSSQQCHIYENDSCSCTGQDWRICNNRSIRDGFVEAAKEARAAAKAALEADHVTVTENER